MDHLTHAAKVSVQHIDHVVGQHGFGEAGEAPNIRKQHCYFLFLSQHLGRNSAERLIMKQRQVFQVQRQSTNGNPTRIDQFGLASDPHIRFQVQMVG